ncbi:hypothetical protein [uncultured Algibacter sp.]|uniref:hypothetical protein n=1 Tax=uncultured Algibacter sp. TaxID=298659 RepID=UPI0026330BF8|nr:hypothetical protein [uncultured Algibacter sp.]
MMNSKKIILIVTLAFLTSNTVFSQWNKGKGNGYYKLSAWYLEADKHYTDTGKKDPNITRSQFNISFYGEYGLLDKLDVITYIPFFSRAVEFDDVSGTTGQIIDEGEAFNSIGDIEIGARYGLLKTDYLALSVSLKLGIPTGDNAGGSDGSFQTGDGEFNQLIQTNLGTSFNLGAVPFYAKTYVGFNNRTEDFSDEFRGGLELGANLLKNKLWLIGRADLLESFQNGDLSAQTAQGSIFANNIEYVSLGAEVAYYITKKLGISFNFTGAISGELIYAAPAYSGGVFLDIK